jgi:hypothetical protein
VHVVVLNVPPLPPSLHVMVPVGTVLVPLLMSLTVALKTTLFPMMTVDGFGDTVVLVIRRLTVCVREPLLVLCVMSPLYIAFIVWEPIDNVDMVPDVAVPPTSATCEPKFTPSIWNCTVPAAPDGDTVAVNVTDWPNTLGLAIDFTVVVVARH